MLISLGQICGTVQAPFIPLPVCPAAVKAGRDQALLLWTIFGAIAAAVPVALVMAISAALGRRTAEGAKRHRRVPAGLIVAGFSIISTYLLLILALFISNARLSMLMEGHVGMFFRAFVFPRGSASLPAVICILFWAGFQGRVIWMLWLMLGPSTKPRVPAGTPDAVRVSALFFSRRWFWPFLASSLVVIVFLFLRLYPIQVTVDRDMAAYQSARHRMKEANDKAAGLLFEHGGAKELVAAWKRTASLGAIAASRSRELAAAEHERDHRVFLFTGVSLGLAVFWLLFVVGRMRSVLGRLRSANRFIRR